MLLIAPETITHTLALKTLTNAPADNPENEIYVISWVTFLTVGHSVLTLNSLFHSIQNLKLFSIKVKELLEPIV